LKLEKEKMKQDETEAAKAVAGGEWSMPQDSNGRNCDIQLLSVYFWSPIY
jgi:hypothetical protein